MLLAILNLAASALIFYALLAVIYLQRKIAMNQADAITALNAATSQLTAIKAGIATLVAAAGSADVVSPELQSAIDGVVAAAQADTDALTPTAGTPAAPAT